MSVDRNIAYLDGEAALPRKNGELVFQAPWEGRAFGLAVVLSDKGAYAWDEFRATLAKQIAAGGEHYYESWLDALESVLLSHGIVTNDEVTQRAAEYEALERDPVF
ncbi:MAG TPA: nitrile hydratase accessory protein [Candidatus Dormibacteraeota bacterium]|nr:nitrile hydratase accessory protein [Candidatus Dormibacteraeota bacterium]